MAVMVVWDAVRVRELLLIYTQRLSDGTPARSLG